MNRPTVLKILHSLLFFPTLIKNSPKRIFNRKGFIQMETKLFVVGIEKVFDVSTARVVHRREFSSSSGG